MGMVIISIFTAALTSSLTTLSLETKVNLPGAKVGRQLQNLFAPAASYETNRGGAMAENKENTRLIQQDEK